METFESTWRINAGSPILLAQLCLPHMEKQGWGRIIFNSSVAALSGGVVGPHYASSKSALHGFVHWLGANVAKKGITVNAIAPALIEDTTMLPAGAEEKEGLKGSKCICLLYLVRGKRTLDPGIVKADFLLRSQKYQLEG